MPDWSQFQHQSFIWPKSVQFEAHLDIFSQIFESAVRSRMYVFFLIYSIYKQFLFLDLTD